LVELSIVAILVLTCDIKLDIKVKWHETQTGTNYIYGTLLQNHGTNHLTLTQEILIKLLKITHLIRLMIQLTHVPVLQSLRRVFGKIRYNLAYKGFLIGTTQEEGHTLPITTTQ
jgi:steroid 5-alpha reductase family enzyme